MRSSKKKRNQEPPGTQEVKSQKKPRRQLDKARGFIAEWSVTILLLLFGTTTLLQAFVVPTSSMENTILIGDHLFVDKLTYAPSGPISRHLLPYREVRRGDIIVFRYPIDLRMSYVKRVIGLPGDRLRIVEKQVYVNGKQIAEPYKQHVPGWSNSYLDNFPAASPNVRLYDPGREMLNDHVRSGELVVPPGKYFAMGDNRDNSEDSRFWGFVPRENIIGKPLIIWWSYDAPTHRLASGDLDPEHIWDLATNFFTKTRWRRTFQLVRAHPLH